MNNCSKCESQCLQCQTQRSTAPAKHYKDKTIDDFKRDMAEILKYSVCDEVREIAARWLE